MPNETQTVLQQPPVQAAWPLVLAHAVSRKLAPKTPLEPGTYALRGKATVSVDVHVKKGEETFRKPTLPKEDLLRIAFTRAAIPVGKIRSLITATLADAAAEEAGMEPIRCEGKTEVVGTVEIVGWEGE